MNKKETIREKQDIYNSNRLYEISILLSNLAGVKENKILSWSEIIEKIKNIDKKKEPNNKDTKTDSEIEIESINIYNKYFLNE